MSEEKTEGTIGFTGLTYDMPYEIGRTSSGYEIRANGEHPHFPGKALICTCPSLNEVVFMLRVLRLNAAVTAAL